MCVIILMNERYQCSSAKMFSQRKGAITELLLFFFQSKMQPNLRFLNSVVFGRANGAHQRSGWSVMSSEMCRLEGLKVSEQKRAVFKRRA